MPTSRAFVRVLLPVVLTALTTTAGGCGAETQQAADRPAPATTDEQAAAFAEEAKEIKGLRPEDLPRPVDPDAGQRAAAETVELRGKVQHIRLTPGAPTTGTATCAPGQVRTVPMTMEVLDGPMVLDVRAFELQDAARISVTVLPGCSQIKRMTTGDTATIDLVFPLGDAASLHYVGSTIEWKLAK